MKNLNTLLLPFFLLTTFYASAQSGYLSDFEKKWENATQYTIEVAEAMPADKYDFKPTEEQQTFKEQLLHILSNMIWLSSDYLGEEKFEKDLKSTDYTKEEILNLLKEGFAFAKNAVDQVEDAQLEEEVKFFAGPMVKRQILTLMNDHVTHHRGQLDVYLRLNGIKPPRYRGW